MKIDYEKEKLEKIVAICNNYSEVVKSFNLKPNCGNRNTIKRYIKKYNINVNHFTCNGHGANSGIKRSLEKILIENSDYTSSTHLKNRLYAEGLKERECELCNQGEEWMGKKMSLILDHINGINNDNRLENLRIVCPNCNATFDTHGGKNRG